MCASFLLCNLTCGHLSPRNNNFNVVLDFNDIFAFLLKILWAQSKISIGAKNCEHVRTNILPLLSRRFASHGNAAGEGNNGENDFCWGSCGQRLRIIDVLVRVTDIMDNLGVIIGRSTSVAHRPLAD